MAMVRGDCFCATRLEGYLRACVDQVGNTFGKFHSSFAGKLWLLHGQDSWREEFFLALDWLHVLDLAGIGQGEQ
eukprot:1133954-Pelagomonas_calceolata.AAC.1